MAADMTPTPQLPNQECSHCLEGNQFMEHVETRTRQVPTLRTALEYTYLAVFRCVKCRRAKTEAFDPSAH